MTRKTELKLARNVALDAATAVVWWYAILARTGAGKTYTGMVLCEEMIAAGAQVVVLDPMSKWWALRVSRDGRSAAYPILIFGGPHGDLPLTPTSGPLVADLVVDKQLSVVLDVSDFDSDADQRRFATAFAKRLYQRKRRERSPAPMHVFLEEAEEFLPQDQMRDQAQMIGAFKKLIKLGRNYGIGGTLISQRSADVNKKGLSQIGTLIALQTTSPHDRKAIREWIHGVGAEDVDLKQLPKLKVGEAFIWSPSQDLSVRCKIRKKTTFDSSATPKVGRRKKASVRPLSPGELEDVQTAMAETAQEASKNDPTQLRRRIRELERQLAKQPEQIEQIREVKVPVVDSAAFTAVEIAAESVETAVKEALEQAVGDLHRAVDRAKKKSPDPSPANRWAAKKVLAKAARPAPAAAAPNGVKLKKGARKMLAALASAHPTPLSRVQLGTLAGYAIKGGTFQDYLSTLRRNGLINHSPRHGGPISITAAGRAMVPDDQITPTTTEELVALWSRRLKKGARRMLKLLVESYPAGLSRTELGDRLGYTISGGTFQDYLSTLRRNHLSDDRDGLIYASETLFP